MNLRKCIYIYTCVICPLRGYPHTLSQDYLVLSTLNWACLSFCASFGKENTGIGVPGTIKQATKLVKQSKFVQGIDEDDAAPSKPITLPCADRSKGNNDNDLRDLHLEN